MKSAHDLIMEIEQARALFISTVCDWSPEQIAFKPTPETWSAGDVLEHLYLQEFSLTNRIWKGHDGWRRGSPIWSGEHTNRGRTIQRLTAQLTGRYQSPRSLVPSLGGPLQFWIEALTSCQPRLARLESLLRDTDLEVIVFPHFALGPLDAGQWLGFLSFHIDRHRQQVERLRRCQGFPD
jgi:DinB superfamily